MTQAMTKTETVVTDTQIDLIRRTIAQGATDAELQLFLYDCKRRGVHPLDKMIHFTKRGGKYTPVTSIDYLRSRAAETGEYAGNDDAIFKGTPKAQDFEATVTVYRIVKGVRCSFSATARWSEYFTDTSPMWKKMPHTMLAKVAEGLALRKGFPQQLAGLYSSEEMDQIDSSEPIRDARPAVVEPRQKASHSLSDDARHGSASDDTDWPTLYWPAAKAKLGDEGAREHLSKHGGDFGKAYAAL